LRNAQRTEAHESIGKEAPSMFSSNISRWGSRAAISAGAIYIPLGVFFLVSSQNSDAYRFPADYLAEGFFAIALALTAIALAGLYVGLRERNAPLDMAASVLAIIGHVAMSVSAAASTVAGADTIDVLIPLGFLSAMVGVALLGIITWRARVLPGWSSAALIIAYPATITLSDNGGLLVLGTVWIAVGYVRWAATHEAVLSTSTA
jgi:hypothetical protein